MQSYFMKKCQSGVYRIYNKITKCSYIGSSININKRIIGHINWLNKNKHQNMFLQRAWNKYGEKNFKFSILKLCLPKERIEIEQHYLDKINKLYNLSKIAKYPEATQKTRKLRSLNAKNQHRKGTLGKKSWKVDRKIVAKKIHATKRRNNSYRAPTFKWTNKRKHKVSMAMRKRRAEEKALGMPLSFNTNYYRLKKKRLRELGISWKR